MVEAPGWPGIQPRWTSSAKSGLGTAMLESSRVWFTISHGILNEIYYPRVDQACVRDLGLIVTDGESFFAEVKRNCTTVVESVEDGVPALLLTSTHRGGRFRIVNQVIADPLSDAVLMHIRLDDLGRGGLRLFAILAPHLVNGGAHNRAWRGAYKGDQMLFAYGDGSNLAFAADQPFLASSVGFVGVSDGWQQLSRSFRLTDQYDTATDGNVALTIELAQGPQGASVVAVGFGRSAADAGFHAHSALMTPFETVLNAYAAGWRAWQASLRTLERRTRGHNMYRVSTAVLHSHETPNFPGGFIASLSIPWGFSKSDDDMGGYHLVWPRDLCETAGALLACDADAAVARILRYLRTTQEADGSWPQNCWLDGSAYWRGVQLDECAFPALLLDMATRTGAVKLPVLKTYWQMVRNAAGFVMRNGPRTKQDRWEENAGYTPFTLAVAVASLLAAAEIADELDIDGASDVLRDTADAWNEQIEDWIYVQDTPLAREAGVSGYYIRIAPESPETLGPDLHGQVQVRNHEAGQGSISADALVSTDALALVRFGLRARRRPADSQHRHGHRQAAQGRPAAGAGLASLQYGRLRRKGGRQAVRRRRNRPRLAAAHGGAGALCAGRRAARRSGGAAGDDRGRDQFRRPDPGAGLGRTADPGKRARTRTAVRFGDAARLGACRVRQAPALPGRRRGVRPAAPYGAPLPEGEAAGALQAVARGCSGRQDPFRPGAAARFRASGHCALHPRRLA